MTFPVISIIGAGHMGSSLIGGLINNGHPPEKIIAADPSEAALIKLQETFPVHTVTNNNMAIQTSDVVIFAVKPQLFSEVAIPLASAIQTKKPLVISIAAGIRADSIDHWLGSKIAIVRAMPNTPALIGCGATALYANKQVNNKQRALAESILQAVGIVVWVKDEDLMDTVTALSGSGPAYFFLVMEILEACAEKLGLPGETARLLTLQTALGAARMAIESGIPLAELRRQVTSPGGTTEKAVSVLEEKDLRQLFGAAVEAAKLRSEELANMLGK